MNNPTKFLWTICLTFVISPVFADDEVLDAAEAVREMIEGMDIPQAEKDRFLAQISGVEGIQKAAIKLDIDAVLQEFEITLAEWVDLNQLHKEQIQVMRDLHEEAERKIKAGDLNGAQALLDTAEELLWNSPPGTLPLIQRAKELDDLFTQEVAAAQRDGVDMSAYTSRYQSAVADAEKSLGKALSEYYVEVR